TKTDEPATKPVAAKDATMTAPAIRPWRLLLSALLIMAVALPLILPARASAQDSYSAGWYGPFDDGCYYYWDGYQYTGDYDCGSAASAAAGWYDGDDGCQYYWDGYDYTDVV